jgi:UDP-N-acetylglucosamine diphosphorylase / glucose-1-phosphate thymidylyltransferase / UDP-N-acetylgalactosamine diphosphorylase / glucosamine-1-phosphate N-acetyltransferase / galactosamine-1-phosphate N-acetyltransferase
MKAVILAAGNSTRLQPLTVDRSKVMMPVVNKSVLEHNLDQLIASKVVDEAIIVVGFGSSEVKKTFGSNYGKIKLKYVVQKEQLGTGHALLQAEKSVGKEKKFVVMMGDDLYSGSDIKKCVKHDSCILAKRVSDVSSFGKVVTKGRKLKQIIEKPAGKGIGLANTGCYVLTSNVFSLLKKAKKSKRGEIEVTDAVSKLNVDVEQASFWIPITYPWSVLDANEEILKINEKSKQNIASGAKVEKGSTLKGFVSVGKGTVIKSGAYIEGPVVIGEGCVIGPNCFVRAYTSIGNRCRIGNGVEVKNSVLMDDVIIGHLSYCGDSVIGNGVNFGAGTITANLRHDSGNVKSMVNGKLVDSGRRKLGTIMGDGAKTGIHTSIYPGRKIWTGKSTLPGEIAKKDVI